MIRTERDPAVECMVLENALSAQPSSNWSYLPVEELDRRQEAIRHEEMGPFGWQCESRFELSRSDTRVQRDVGWLNLHVESNARAKRHDSKLRALGPREALDLQRVTVDLHFRTRRAPTTDVRSLDEGNGVLGHRSGVGGDVDLHGSRLYMASVTADVNMNDVRQEPGLTDEDCVVSRKLAAPIAGKTQVIGREELGDNPALMLGSARHTASGRHPGHGITDFHDHTRTQLICASDIKNIAAGKRCGSSQHE